jgi:hypothetical protein
MSSASLVVTVMAAAATSAAAAVDFARAYASPMGPQLDRSPSTSEIRTPATAKT